MLLIHSSSKNLSSSNAETSSYVYPSLLSQVIIVKNVWYEPGIKSNPPKRKYSNVWLLLFASACELFEIGEGSGEDSTLLKPMTKNIVPIMKNTIL